MRWCGSLFKGLTGGKRWQEPDKERSRPQLVLGPSRTRCVSCVKSGSEGLKPLRPGETIGKDWLYRKTEGNDEEGLAWESFPFLSGGEMKGAFIGPRPGHRAAPSPRPRLRKALHSQTTANPTSCRHRILLSPIYHQHMIDFFQSPWDCGFERFFSSCYRCICCGVAFSLMPANLRNGTTVHSGLLGV